MQLRSKEMYKHRKQEEQSLLIVRFFSTNHNARTEQETRLLQQKEKDKACLCDVIK
jgi:hypothetical protein